MYQEPSGPLRSHGREEFPDPVHKLDLSQYERRIEAITWYHEYDFPNGLKARSKAPDVEHHRRDLTGVFCTSGSEREFTLEERWYAHEAVQAGADHHAASAN